MAIDNDLHTDDRGDIIIDLFTPTECQNYFTAAGYAKKRNEL